MGRGSGLARRLVWAFAVLIAPILRAEVVVTGNAPSYTAAGVVQAATQAAGPLAPNSIATLYGTNLSWDTYAVRSSDISNGRMPLALEGVTVLVNGMPSNLFYVSPGQINFLVPYEITTSTVNIQVVRQGAAGPAVTLPMQAVAPGFFVWNSNLALGEHVDGTLISPQAPAHEGEVVVLYAGGLGRTAPDITSGQIVNRATPILLASQLEVLLNGVPCPAGSVFYAGLAPDFAGLYQINLQLPANVPANPQIQISIVSAAGAAQTSAPGVVLPLSGN
jgi:uncharacterized protein (TIGR03437 family)